MYTVARKNANTYNAMLRFGYIVTIYSLNYAEGADLILEEFYSRSRRYCYAIMRGIKHLILHQEMAKKLENPEINHAFSAVFALTSQN